MTDAKPTQTYSELTALRAFMGKPSELAAKKSITRLDKHCREFISRSPFVCIGTTDGAGNADVSPKGDPPGFVQVLDDKTLFIPDRPGNNRIDSMSNLLREPAIALLFLIPGFDETLRVNGKASVIRDQTLNAASIVKGRVPKIGIKVTVDTAFLHCAKALKRSHLWDPKSLQDRKSMPSLGQMITEQTTRPGKDTDQTEISQAEQRIQESIRSNLY